MAGSTATRTPTPRLRLQEGGLVLVIILLGAVLTIFGGTVREPKFRISAQGEPERVFTKTATGAES